MALELKLWEMMVPQDTWAQLQSKLWVQEPCSELQVPQVPPKKYVPLLVALQSNFAQPPWVIH